MARVEETLVKQKPMPRKQGEGEGRYLLSFVWMLLLTAVSFVLVGVNLLPESLTILTILVLASFQVLMQFFTFMHLDFKWYLTLTLFMGTGCIVAATAIAAMVFWV